MGKKTETDGQWVTEEDKTQKWMSSIGTGQISCRKWVSFYLRSSLILLTLYTPLLFPPLPRPPLFAVDGWTTWKWQPSFFWECFLWRKTVWGETGEKYRIQIQVKHPFQLIWIVAHLYIYIKTKRQTECDWTNCSVSKHVNIPSNILILIQLRS